MSEPYPEQYLSWRFNAHDGLEIYAISNLPATPVKAHVILIHGIVEHSARYKHVFAYLTSHGYGVHAIDLRGHGESEGVRGYTEKFGDYISDVKRFHSQIRSKFPEKDIFMIGHSLGGLIVTSYVILQQANLKGVILSGAALKLGEDFSPILIFLAPYIAKWMPHLRVAKINTSAISRDPLVVKTYTDDPHVFQQGPPAKTGVETIKAIKQVQGCMEEFRLPVLIMHGTDDKLINIKGSEELFERADSQDKILRLYEGFYHEIFNEPQKELVLKDVLNWLEERYTKN